jgi:hypothetical protein
MVSVIVSTRHTSQELLCSLLFLLTHFAILYFHLLVCDKYSGEGRTPSTMHWYKMRRTVAQLKMELDMVELDWEDSEADDDEEAPTSSSRPFSTGTSDHTASRQDDLKC